MKRSLSLTLDILVKLGTCLAACIGCSSKNPPDPEKLHVIRWKGQDGGYEDTTPVQPTANASSTDNQ